MSEEVVVKDRSGFVYLLKSESGHYKIGRSKDPEARLDSLDSGPLPVFLVHRIATDHTPWLEKRLHKKYAAKRVRGEWFSLSEEDVAMILTLDRIDRPRSIVQRIFRRKRRRNRWRKSDPLRPQGAFPFPDDPPKQSTAFKDKLRELRQLAGFTQEELAESSGVPVFTIRGHEQGQRLPSWVVFMKLVRALGATINDFEDCDELEDNKLVRKKRKR